MEQEAFKDVVRQYQAGLRAYIRRLGVARDWVDDIAQETFMVAYRRWDDFDQDMDAGRWLYGIARKLVANEFRKSQRKARVVYIPLSEKLLAAADQERRRAVPRQTSRLAEALIECVERLPRYSRQLLYRRYAEDQNASQLSEHLHISPGAIRLRLMRIRAAVKRCVEGKLPEAQI